MNRIHSPLFSQQHTGDLGKTRASQECIIAYGHWKDEVELTMKVNLDREANGIVLAALPDFPAPGRNSGWEFVDMLHLISTDLGATLTNEDGTITASTARVAAYDAIWSGIREGLIENRAEAQDQARIERGPRVRSGIELLTIDQVSEIAQLGRVGRYPAWLNDESIPESARRAAFAQLPQDAREAYDAENYTDEDGSIVGLVEGTKNVEEADPNGDAASA
jgi:hypothetical protein